MEKAILSLFMHSFLVIAVGLSYEHQVKKYSSPALERLDLSGKQTNKQAVKVSDSSINNEDTKETCGVETCLVGMCVCSQIE